MKLHQLLFHAFLFLLPIQTRILYWPDKAYVSWYFDYHLAIFVYLTDLLLMVCIAIWLIFDRPSMEFWPKNRLFLLILGFLSLCLVTLFHVKRMDLGLYQSIKWLEFFAILLYIRFNFKTIRDLEIAGWIIFSSAIFQAIIGWLQFQVQHMLGLKLLGEYISTAGTAGLSTIDTATGKIIRAYGTLPHPNVLGAYLVSGLVSGLILVSHETRWRRLIAFVGLTLITITLFATFSRIAWAAAGLAVISFLIYNLWNRRRTIVVGILVSLIVSCATIFIFYGDTLESRISQSSSVSVEDRYFFNQLGIDMVKKFPSLGVGVGNYVPALQDLFVLEPWQHQPAHNIFIFLSAELGILGVALFIRILVEIFWVSKSMVKDIWPYGLVVLGIIFILMGQFDHYFVTIQQGRLLFAVILGLIAALPNIYDYQRNN